MSEPATRTPLVEQVLSGDNRELRRLAASGILPLPPDELVPLLVELTKTDDAKIAELSSHTLAELDPRVVREFLRNDAVGEVLAYFAQHHEHPAVLEVILQRRDVSPEVVQALAPRLSPDLQEILLLRQDLIVEHRDILIALESNPQLSNFAARRISEYREHLFGERRRQPEVELPVEEEEELTPDELEDIDEVRKTVEASGELDTTTGLTEAQIRALMPTVRMKLARGASRTLRSILIKDKNPNVACAVLSSSAVTEQEIEQISNNRYVVEDVLVRIANKREWAGKYTIMHNLVRNPRTPVAIAVRYVARLAVRDLNQLRLDRNVPDAVRQQALRLHRLKSAK